jgi:hypothetical protein
VKAARLSAGQFTCAVFAIDPMILANQAVVYFLATRMMRLPRRIRHCAGSQPGHNQSDRSGRPFTFNHHIILSSNDGHIPRSSSDASLPSAV